MTSATQSTASGVLLGCIADDFTGATDLANMLVREGMRTLLIIGDATFLNQQSNQNQVNVPADIDAIVIALKSRTIASDAAIKQSLQALAWLKLQGCRQYFFKYCSTFDSTPAGNIGQVSQALMQALDTDFAIACPVFPETGRTLYRGHLFIHNQLLSESSMRNHPLTPMTDANLVRVLQQQTTLPVGLIGYEVVRQGADAIKAEIAQLKQQGIKLALVDAVENQDLYAIGAACDDAVLVTGGSGVALGLPANLVKAGFINTAQKSINTQQQNDDAQGWAVVIAGSVSQATNQQVEVWKAQRPAFYIDPLAIAKGQPVVDQAVQFCLEHHQQHKQTCLLYATSPSQQVQQIQAQLGVDAASLLIENALAECAKQLAALGVRTLVVAGGETSGAVVQALQINALRIGTQIDPGIPATTAMGEIPYRMALKSGNFGTPDFFEKALRHLDAETGSTPK